MLLRQPATEVELNNAEKALGHKIPDSLRVIYRLHNGQELYCDKDYPELLPKEDLFYGLFGGYVPYLLLQTIAFAH